MIKARYWTRPNEFKGDVSENDFQLIEENISQELKDGEVLCEAIYLSVDPYMRVFDHADPIGKHKTMYGEACSKVMKTRNGDFTLGTLVLSHSGWRTHFVSPDGKDLRPIRFDLDSLSPSITLGVLGMPGLTAYFGLRWCKPKASEVCVVNGAAGAVGSVVGQLTKIKGLTVIGFAGSDEKCDWLKTELEFDYAFNYKKISIDNALKKAAPFGVNIFFDNVGGDFFHEMLTKHMAPCGRVCLSGSISTYNDKETKKYPAINMNILTRKLSVRGFYVGEYANEFDTALDEMASLLHKGDLKFKETIYDGFEKMPQAFIGLFKGDNTGKAIIEIDNFDRFFE